MKVANFLGHPIYSQNIFRG